MSILQMHPDIHRRRETQIDQLLKRLENMHVATVLPDMEYVDALTESTPLPPELAIATLDHAGLYSSTVLESSIEGLPVVIEQNELAVIKSQPLSARGAAQLRKVIVRFTAKDQGWSSSPRHMHGTYEGSYTWFTIRVITGARQQSREIQRNRHAGRSLESYCHEFTLDDDILDGLAEGSVIELLAGAHFPGWSNRVAAASIEFQSEYTFTSHKTSLFMTST